MIEIVEDMLCPVCGSRPQVSQMAEPWNDYLAYCPECGFSYAELGDFGSTEKEAIFLWNYDVQINGLESVTLSAANNSLQSQFWKDKKEWYLQQNKSLGNS